MTTSNEVTIEIVTVTLETIKVSGKQMTQALFKQIPIVPPFNDDGLSCIDVLLGTINYHDKVECKEYGLHYHFLWQQEGELYKWTIFPDWENQKWMKDKIRLITDQRFDTLVDACVIKATKDDWMAEYDTVKKTYSLSYDDYCISVKNYYEGEQRDILAAYWDRLRFLKYLKGLKLKQEKGIELNTIEESKLEKEEQETKTLKQRFSDLQKYRATLSSSQEVILENVTRLGHQWDNFINQYNKLYEDVSNANVKGKKIKYIAA